MDGNWSNTDRTRTSHNKIIRTVDGSKPRNFTYKPIYELHFTSSTCIHISLMNLSVNILYEFSCFQKMPRAISSKSS